ncbi:hypothetical protein N7U66_09755 [Lacinutrix neustonica]|uniref:Lipoprotein n=1 Tax=Lacinutrix neustonica TaxID=2980107 RepID=A0A9E8SFQ7_9FLAO|nr:hypothetical protein [Lacinutrix neustonica]WAC03694.1 hypothetical protein N7U66_09755 [Lacinutrix neustonica]
MLKKTIFIALGLIMLSCNSSDDNENQEGTDTNNYIYFMSRKNR